jgi:hypothetical protein
MNIPETAREILAEGVDDWIPIDRAVYLAGDRASIAGRSRDEIFKESMEFLLSNGLVTLGKIGESGYEPCNSGGGDIVRALITRLIEVDWRPQGALCWIANTALGDHVATSQQGRH